MSDIGFIDPRGDFHAIGDECPSYRGPDELHMILWQWPQ